MEWWMYLAGGVLILTIGLLIGYAYRKNVAEAKVAKAEDAVKQLYEEARVKAADIKKEMILEAKEEAIKTRTETERENRERRAELQRTERRLFQREESLDKKMEGLEQREKELAKRENGVEKAEADVAALHDQQLAELERISGLSMDAAREILLENVEREARHDAALLIREIEAKNKRGGGQTRSQYRRVSHPAVRSGPCGGNDGIRRAVAQR